MKRSGLEVVGDLVYFNGRSASLEDVKQFLYEEHWEDAPQDDTREDAEAWLEFIFARRRDVKNFIQEFGVGEAESFFDYDELEEAEINGRMLERAIANLSAA